MPDPSSLHSQQFWQTAEHPSCLNLLHFDGLDRIQTCPETLGQGYCQNIPLRDDMTLVIVDYELDQDVHIEGFPPLNAIEFTFRLAGPEVGQNRIVVHTGQSAYPVKLDRQRVFRVEVFVKSPTMEVYLHDLLHRLPPDQKQLVAAFFQQLHVCRFGRTSPMSPSAWAQLLHSDSDISLPQALEQVGPDLMTPANLQLMDQALLRPTTSRMQQVLNQILHCPYQGLTRRLHLESRALDLITLQMEQLSQLRLPSTHLNQLSLKDIQRIHQAKSILLQDLENPPSLKGLAKQVGLNDYKLKLGFRQVFGTTVFGCLREHRLEQAQQLLISGKTNVTQAAVDVGYNSLSSFNAAFKKKFGVNPSQYLVSRQMG